MAVCPPIYIEVRTGGQRVWKMDGPYLDGAEAAKQGKPLGENPYLLGSADHTQWSGGYRNQLDGEHLRYGGDATDGFSWMNQRGLAIFFPVDEDIPRADKDGRIARNFLLHHLPPHIPDQDDETDDADDSSSDPEPCDSAPSPAALPKDDELDALLYDISDLFDWDDDSETDGGSDHDDVAPDLPKDTNDKPPSNDGQDFLSFMAHAYEDMEMFNRPQAACKRGVSPQAPVLASGAREEVARKALKRLEHCQALFEHQIEATAPLVNEIVRHDGRISRVIGIEWDGREPCYILKYPRPGKSRRSVLTLDGLDLMREELPPEEYQELDERMTSQRCGPVLKFLVEEEHEDDYTYETGMILTCLYFDNEIIDYLAFGPFLTRQAEDSFMAGLPPFHAKVRLPWDEAIKRSDNFHGVTPPRDFGRRVADSKMRPSEREEARRHMRTRWRRDIEAAERKRRY